MQKNGFVPGGIPGFAMAWPPWRRLIALGDLQSPASRQFVVIPSFCGACYCRGGGSRSPTITWSVGAGGCACWSGKSTPSGIAALLLGVLAVVAFLCAVIVPCPPLPTPGVQTYIVPLCRYQLCSLERQPFPVVDLLRLGSCLYYSTSFT